MAALICGPPAPRICCNGPRRNGTSCERSGRDDECRHVLPALPIARFPAKAEACELGVAGHLPVTILREPHLNMLWRIRTALVAGMVVCGLTGLAHAQSASPNPAKAAAKQTDTKPPPAVTGGAEPTLIGQYGTWGAYTATPNGKR